MWITAIRSSPPAFSSVLIPLLGSLGEEGLQTFARSGARLWASYGYTTAQEGRSSAGVVDAIRAVGAAGDSPTGCGSRYSWHCVDYMYHSDRQTAHLVRDYAETLMAVDDSISRVVRFLERNDLADDTLVIYMVTAIPAYSDEVESLHTELFGFLEENDALGVIFRTPNLNGFVQRERRNHPD